ncbi:MAG: TRAP transporter substrate-binding protein [Rubrimonas sp.]|uniref:TRAP transporter substrate-binding protein n=1 Tax=Rubrimonas sp. TaxID=2036015 RepID=UPI002FDCF965
MKRRDFLRTAGAAAAGGTALAAPALAQSAAKVTLVGAFPRGFPGVGVNAERLAARLTALSDGKLEVAYFGGGELVPPFGVFDAVSSGAAQFGHTASYYAVGQVRATMYFTTFPYALMQEELSGWIHYGGGQALWDEAYAPHGVKPFYAGGSGAQAGGWFRKPIASLDDLQGLKMRIGGLGGDVMKKVGVSTILTPPAEIFSSLQSGVVDAAEFVGPWNDLALGLYQIAPYYYLPAFHEPGAALECIVNLDFYENLSPWLKTVVATAASATADETYADFRYHNTRVLKDLVGRGAIVSAFPADVTAALGAAAKEVIAAYPQGDPMCEKIHPVYFDYVRDCAAYGAAVEGRAYAERAAVWGV